MKTIHLLLILIAVLLLGGAQTRLGEPPAAQAAFPGENGLIVFARFIGTSNQLFTVNPDGTGLAGISGTEGASDPAWSPDGSRIAFGGTASIGFDIFVIDADGGNLQQLTNGGSNVSTANAAPQWSPDGQKIVFWSNREASDGFSDVFVMNADGSGQQNLTPGAGGGVYPTFSPDGTTIAFASVDGISVMSANGSGRTLLVSGEGLYQPSWSPDGAHIAYYDGSSASEGDFRSEIFKVAASGGVPQLLQTDAGASRWSPRGDEIVFNRTVVPVGLSIMDSDGSNIRILTTGNDSHPDWQALGGQCTGTPSALASASASTDDDTDGDNIPDNIENNVSHTDPNCADTDGDGLLDPWEVEENVEGAGFDLDDDGDVEVTRDKVFGPYAGNCGSESTGPRREPLGQNCGLMFRPDPLHKDVYVEIDWQDCFLGDCPEPTGFNGESLNLPLDPSHHAPNMAGLQDVVDMFRSAPVDNPDDTQGVNLNILVDEAIPHAHNCDQKAAEARAENFGTASQQGDAAVIQAREMVFRYAWSGHSSIKDYSPPPNESCPLPAFWEIIASGAGAHPLPEYDISPHGWADPGGRDILVSLAITWICQLYTFDGPQNINHSAPCFRQTIRNPIIIPGLFPARVAQANGGSVAAEYPIHMMLGLQPSQGVRQLWGRSFANLLGSSLGVSPGGIGNDPNTSGLAPVQSYASWFGAAYAPPAVPAGGSALAQGPGGSSFVPIMPDFSLAEADGDGDGTPEGADTCPGIANPGQADLDGDGFGDECDLDIDGDGIDAAEDDHPGDTDNDGADNDADADDDGDGAEDGADNCPLNANPGQENADGDAAGDACDYDSDGDGLPDVMEEIMGSDPLSEDRGPEFVGYEGTCSDGLDNDGDGDGDAADNGCGDPDGDTVPDLLDNCPDIASINIADSDDDGEGDRCDPAYLSGDVDCSGAVNSIDALKLSRHVAGLSVAQTEPCPDIGTGGADIFGDVNCDAQITAVDTLFVLRFVAALPVNVPQGCRQVGT